MDMVSEKVEELVNAIKDSAEYQRFQEAEQQVSSVPGLAEKVREFCWNNYKLQNSETEDLYERMEEFEDRYREFRSDPIVAQYLERELQMCRMLQGINARITDAVELIL